MEVAIEQYRSRVAQQVRDELVIDHIPLARHVVQRAITSLPRSVDRENVEAAAMLGLVEAAQRFDPAHGVQFSAFARSRIHGAVMDELRRNCPIPSSLLRRWTQIRRALREHSLSFNADPQVMADAAGFSLDEVRECLAAVQMARQVSINDDLAGDIAETNSIAPACGLENSELQHLVADEIEHLEEQQRVVLSMYFTDDMRLAEIGEVLGLSESRICRILKEAKELVRERITRRLD